MQFGQDGNLLDDVFHLVFGVFYIDDLDGNRLPGPAVNSETFVSKGSERCVCRVDIPFVDLAEAPTTWIKSDAILTL